MLVYVETIAVRRRESMKRQPKQSKPNDSNLKPIAKPAKSKVLSDVELKKISGGRGSPMNHNQARF